MPVNPDWNADCALRERDLGFAIGCATANFGTLWVIDFIAERLIGIPKSSTSLTIAGPRQVRKVNAWYYAKETDSFPSTTSAHRLRLGDLMLPAGKA